MAIGLLFACGTSGKPSPEATPATPTPTAVPPPPAPSTACTADAQCNFADPKRCIAAPGGTASATGDSCVCFEGTCAMRPSTPRISAMSCETTHDCNLDVATAQCGPDVISSDDLRGRYFGPTCGCNPRDQRCHLQWFEPVACTSADDCWIDEQPVTHAIRRPARLKGRKFRGCVDGERVPACVAGRCTLDALRC
jgi:hypothetical protein